MVVVKMQFTWYAFPLTLNVFDSTLLIKMLLLRVKQNPDTTRLCSSNKYRLVL